EPAVADLALQVVDEQRVGVDHHQLAAARQPVEHRAAERADAGTVLDEQLALVPLHRGEHLVDRRTRRRDDRADHPRMFEKSPEEHTRRAESPFEPLKRSAPWHFGQLVAVHGWMRAPSSASGLLAVKRRDWQI